MLYVKGKIASLREKEYKGEVTRYIQFLQDTGNGLELIEVKIAPGDERHYEKGKDVDVKITYSMMNDRVYWRTLP